MKHTWQINQLERRKSDGVVNIVDYSCRTEDTGSGKLYNTATLGKYSLPEKSSLDADFIPFENLTENVVLGWITGSIDKAGIELANSSSISASIAYDSSQLKGIGVPW